MLNFILFTRGCTRCSPIDRVSLKPVKKLDIYIIKKFLGTFVFMILAFIVIAVVFDVSENIDDLIKSGAPLIEIIVDYYLNFCFYFGNLLSSFIIFLTIIWITSKLAQKSEIVAMLSGGISFRRIMFPYFISASILVTLTLFLSHFIVPRANRAKLDFELKYLKGSLTVAEQNLHREIEPGTIAYFKKVFPGQSSGSQFSLEKWKKGKLIFKMFGTNATYDEKTNRWQVTNAELRYFEKDGSERHVFKARLDTTFNMKLDDFAQRSEVVSAMSDKELDVYLAEEKLVGSGKIAHIELEKYNRTAGPFSIFVLTLIGVSLSSRKTRGGTGLHIFLAVVIGFIFIFISRMTTVSAMTVGFPTALAVWVPSIIFSFVGLYLYTRAQK